jgi:Flp pilus assembly protein TadG
VIAGRISKVSTRERGSATVEFVLVLPLVLTMALALLQVGLLAKDQLVLMESARAGAREGSVSIADADVEQAAIEAAATLDSSRIEVTVEREGGVGAPVTVSVTYQAPIVVPLVAWLFPADIELGATATMRQETE